MSKYSIEELQEVMREHNLVIRTIPEVVTQILEAYHTVPKGYENGVVKYLEEYKREMLVVEKKVEHGGCFIVEECRHNMHMVLFQKMKGKVRYFDSIDEIIEFYENQQDA